MKEPRGFAGPSCPIPTDQYPSVLLGHGGGGRLSQQLIEGMFLPLFQNPFIDARHDGAVMGWPTSGSPSPPIPTSCGPSFFRGAISALSR